MLIYLSFLALSVISVAVLGVFLTLVVRIPGGAAMGRDDDFLQRTVIINKSTKD